MYIPFSPIVLPWSLDALLALLPDPFSSASSSSDSDSSASSSRRSDGASAASTNHLRLACDLAELAGLVARAAPGERWIERAAVSVSAGMVLLTVVRGSPLPTLPTPTHIRILPLPAHLSPNDVVYAPVRVGALTATVHGADKSVHGALAASFHHGEKEGGSNLVSRAMDVGASTRRVWEGREGRAHAGLPGVARVPGHAREQGRKRGTRRPGVAGGGCRAREAGVALLLLIFVPPYSPSSVMRLL
ncbi:hypothetical protein C8J57DRAFT_1469727 [Mycena rebaudengoi]|nr:hypothetical protein C8J57DRAFT_1469727 [Mycena rebaudengoi]